MQLINYLYTHSIALAFFLLASFAAISHVFAPLPIIFLLCYLALLIYFPRLWLVAIPALLPILDLSLWTGNLLYNEYDILLLLTLAVLFWRKDTTEKVAAPPYQLLYWLLLIAFTASFLKNFGPLLESGLQPDDIYQSNWNSLRIGKGFFYAWFLWPFIRQELDVHPKLSQRLLATGITASLLIFGLLVLWERHVLSALPPFHDRYEFLSALLDFSSTYRITGWFTEMHVGGEAVDGYLVSLTPLVVYLLTRQLRQVEFAILLLTASLGFYAVIVTFTRTTIASFTLSLFVTLLVLAVSKRNSFKSTHNAFLPPFVLFLLCFIGLFLGFKLAGYQALLTGLMSFFAALLSGYFLFGRNREWQWLGIAAIVLLTLSVLGTSNSALESKWHFFSYSDAIRLAVLLSISHVSLGLLLGRIAKKQAIPLKNLQIAAVFIGLFLFLAIGLSSTRFEQRFSEVSGDLSTREHHWLQMISFRTPDSFSSAVIGEGVGTIPSLFYQNTLLTRSLPSFRIAEENGQPFLILGAGEFNFFQKIFLEPEQDYHLTVTARFKSLADKLVISVCKKHILTSEHYQPSCISNGFKPSHIDTWDAYNWDFKYTEKDTWLDWPTTLVIHNDSKQAVEIGSITINSPTENQVIRNGGFTDKLQSWLWVIDFDHLPWHSKELFIHVWLEQGGLGLVLFICLFVFAFKHQCALLVKGSSVPLAFLPSMAAIILEGFTGTMLDAPRVCTQIYLILFAALQWPDPNAPKNQSNSRSVHSSRNKRNPGRVANPTATNNHSTHTRRTKISAIMGSLI